MPIISNFPTGGGSGSGGLTLAAVTNIKTQTASGKVYVKWTDPEDLVVAESTLAAWGGTLLVRKAGSAPVSRRDGTIVVDSKERNAYRDKYFCDSGLSNGTTYYYKFFPYTTANSYTDSPDDEFNKTPQVVLLGDVSGMSAVPAGNGKIALKWTDPAATIVTDGVTLATWAKTIVVVKKGSYATSPDDEAAAYTSHVTSRNAHVSSPLIVSGLENGVKYYVSLFPTSTDGAVNTSASNRVSGTANRMTIAAAPSQSGSLTYNGTSQKPTWSNYDSSKMSLNVTGQTNAGTYSATFTPTNDYMWSDGSVAGKAVSWKINKAAGSLSLSEASITLNSSAKSATFTVTRTGDGKITVESSNTSVATVSLSGTTVTVSSVNDTTGEATITVKVAAGTNHNAPANKTCAVAAQFIPSLNDATWDEIRKVSDAGQAANYWAIGDRKSVTLNGTCSKLNFSNQKYYCYIIGIDHNSTREGANRIHFQFGYTALSGGTHIAFIDSDFCMDSSGSNYDGWGDSFMRNTVCAQFKNCLPSDLVSVLKTVTKYSDNTGGGYNRAGYVAATTEELFLIAEFEIFGTRIYANSAEQNYQAQYQYYKNGNSRVRYRHSDTGSTVCWWLRSVYAGNTSGFCNVDTSGSADYSPARNSFGFAPAFCV